MKYEVLKITEILGEIPVYGAIKVYENQVCSFDTKFHIFQNSFIINGFSG